MPIYSYKCTSCSHEFDLKQGFDADPVQECPVCQSSSRRLFHPVGVIYKGSGFYTTDYRKPESSSESKSRTSKSSSSEPSGSSSTSSEGSSDSSASTEKSAVEKPAEKSQEKSTKSASSTSSSD